MALELEATRSEESSLEITAMDFIGIRRADRATCAQQNLSAGVAATFRRQPGLATAVASLPFTASRPILNLYAPRRCRDGELYRSSRFVPPSNDALSRRSALHKLDKRLSPSPTTTESFARERRAICGGWQEGLNQIPLVGNPKTHPSWAGSNPI